MLIFRDYFEVYKDNNYQINSQDVWGTLAIILNMVESFIDSYYFFSLVTRQVLT